MCEFRLRVVLEDGNERHIVCKDAINVKLCSDKLSILRVNGELIEVDNVHIREVDAERQVVILSRSS